MDKLYKIKIKYLVDNSELEIETECLENEIINVVETLSFTVREITNRERNRIKREIDMSMKDFLNR